MFSSTASPAPPAWDYKLRLATAASAKTGVPATSGGAETWIQDYGRLYSLPLSAARETTRSPTAEEKYGPVGLVETPSFRKWKSLSLGKMARCCADVRRILCGVNPRKAAGPDNIPGRVLRECADQLADVLTDIFDISLSCTVVPTCCKTTTIVPVPKKPTVSCLNDYHPVALTSIIMKCFERLVMRHIKTQLDPSLDLLQSMYRSNCSTDDAISTTFHLVLTYLDKKGTYMRMLFRLQFSIQHHRSSPSDWKVDPGFLDW
ncbi:hypothetical protein P4O66_016384 [Electrophorus voltai]|uniref:Reverse transcriptase domain-containing protein n=1 Tax=Electrophorus voltai TaxID=2609070 RepID=A0AAD8YUZ1_9TELE|nr:hypothetical protein P4O66_016384 [Electrophorus voltai]